VSSSVSRPHETLSDRLPIPLYSFKRIAHHELHQCFREWDRRLLQETLGRSTRTQSNPIHDGRPCRRTLTNASAYSNIKPWLEKPSASKSSRASLQHLSGPGHVLPKDSFHQDPSSEHMYLKKTDEECEIIAAQILRIKQCEENESTLISYLNSSLLPWPLVYHHPILGRIHDRPIFEISTLEEPPLHQQNNNNQYFSWKIIPDILYLYNVRRFEKNDILALKGLGLSKNIIALNGEFKSEAGSALQARTQLICAGVLVLWQRIKIRKAAACSDTSDLSHYCFSMCSGDFEFWCLKHVDDAFHAQQYACGTLINAAGVRKFIEIWNCVINHVIGSQWESLRTDIRPRVVVTSNHRDNWASRLRQRG